MTLRNKLLAAAHMIDQARTKEDREQAEREFDELVEAEYDRGYKDGFFNGSR